MSRTTNEINKVTGTVIGVSARMIIIILVLFLLFVGVTKGYEFGHDIFYATSISEAPGEDVAVTIPEGMSASAAAKLLRREGLIRNEFAFVVQSKFYEYEVYPGTYTLNTSMTSKDMLQLINENKPEDEESEEGK